ncbi:beta-N-acetylhexosaminidase [Parapedobacter lycopersici]|uniref:beta-N-acetylhexosaminidase n=1 Tax=Parapedobacter lycopersici TaxID=1864939 RepID=UPI00334292A4
MNKLMHRDALYKGLLPLILCLALTVSLAGHVSGAEQMGAGFQVRGFHLDLRVQVMKMPALRAFAHQLSENGINTLIMEWEASYPYQQHQVISNRYAYSREEVKSFVAYCDSLGIDVIPLQQSFGHVEYILRHYRYRDLREDQKDFSQVNPLKEDLCKALFTDLYRDLIETHTSDYIHIGGDETYLLGHSKESQEKIARVGRGRLYGDYLKMLCELVVSLGKRPIVWADIALKYPDAFRDLPKETVFVDWNYGWPLDRFGDHRQLVESGYEVWGAPSIRSHPDNYFLADWNKHFLNIQSFVPQARELGYKGIVMTSWSTSGIYSPVFESSSDIIDLPAIRRVYPLTGFNLLVAAYFESLRSADALDINKFVHTYTRETYGFDDAAADVFWRALTMTPYEVTQGRVSHPGMTVSALRDSAMLASNLFRQLKPSKNQDEFAHYLLMSDIRTFYLECMAVEYQLNLPDLGGATPGELADRLRRLHPEELDKRFIDLQKHAFYLSELNLENELRNARLKSLLAKLEKVTD